MSTQAYTPKIPSGMGTQALRQPFLKQLQIQNSTVFTYQWKQEFSSYTHALRAYFLLPKTGLLIGRGKKGQISRDFQGQIRGKNGRFRGNFAGIFKASFAEKRLVNNGRFHGRFPSKFCWKAIGFALICGKFSMKLDALIDLSAFIPQYESVLYKYKAY